MSLRVLRALIRKDIRLFRSDRRAVMIGFILPIALASFFGFLFGGRRGKAERNRIKIAVAVEEQTAAATRLLADLTGDPSLNVTAGTPAEARAAVAKGNVGTAIVVPAGFGGAGKPEIVLLVDPSRATEAAMLQGLIARHVVGALLGRQAPVERPFTMRTEEVTASLESSYNGYAHSFAGMGVQFMLMSSLEAGIAILLQRQRGLWKRLRAAPLSKTMLLGSRALSGALISLMVLLVLFLFGGVVFGIRIQGSQAGFLGVCVAAALMSSTFGLLVAALGKTPEATRPLSIFVILVVVMLGGAWVPSFLFPPWLQQVAALSPAKWAVDGLDATIWRGLGFDAAIMPILALLGFSVVFGALATWRFRWEE